MKNIIFVIDAYNLIYRMFYAIPEMHTRDGIQVNAIFGVAKFLKTLSEQNPDATLVVATDLWPSFREEVFNSYKWTRDRMPDNLRSQIDWVFSLFKALDIQIIGKQWYEADDVMWTIANKYWNDKNQVIIISSDKDLCQFVINDKVHIYNAMKRKFMREKDVIEKFGIPNTKVRDYLAIVGDTSDNIPWISGIWPKKAVEFLEKYWSLDNIYQNILDFTPKMREKLENWKENAFLSQKLATIITDLNIEDIIINSFSKKISSPEYINILKQYEFRSLLPFLENSEKNKQDIKNNIINDINKYEELVTKWCTTDSILWIYIDNENNIYISDWWVVYTFDSKKIDVITLIDNIFNWNIKISSYNIKNILIALDKIKNPIKKSSNQVSLF